MSKFEQQKQKIVDFIVNGLIESDNGHDKAIIAIKFNQMMTELQPEYPTCATCRYCMYDGDDEFCCENGNVVNVVALDSRDIENFGCIHHSSLENK